MLARSLGMTYASIELCAWAHARWLASLREKGFLSSNVGSRLFLISLSEQLLMSASVIGLYLLLIVIVGLRLCSSVKKESWKTHCVADVDEAISKIKEMYPNAVTGPWQTDRDGWLPAGEIMFIWQDQEARDGNAPPVAWIRRYCP